MNANPARQRLTTQRPTDDEPVFADGAGATVEIDINASPETVWALVSDINLPGQFSDEFQGAEWVSDTPEVGAVFTGRNKNKLMGEWEVPCTLTHHQINEVFAWASVSAENPAAHWRFDLTPQDNGTLLTFTMILGPGPSGLTMFIEKMPDKEAAIVHNRQTSQAANMACTVEGIRDLAENKITPTEETP